MAADYDAARRLVGKLAKKTEREELEKEERYYNEETTAEEKAADAESAADMRAAIEAGGGLIIDIAESLSRIAGDKLSSGRRL